MPVRYNKGGNTYDRDEYSFHTGDYVTSRDFARSRRFGADDSNENRPMALVSSPLQMPFVGRRTTSPYRESPAPHIQQQTNYDDEDLDEEIRMVQRQRRESLENRRRMDYRHLNYDEYEDDLEPLVPTYQPRLPRVSERSERFSQQRYESPPPRYSSRQQHRPPVLEFEEDYPEATEPRQQYKRQHQEYVRRQAPRQMEQDEQRSRKQDNFTSDVADITYSVPAPRKCSDPSMEEQEESLRSIAGYIAKRKQFAVEDDEDMHYYKNPNYQYRILTGDCPRVSDREAEESMNRSKVDKAPMFDMKLRSHVVWEKMFVKFTCTVRGHPQPRVTWYKDMVPIEPSLHQPGKFKISNQFGLHTLEISRTSIEDSGTYRVSVQNRKGEISSYATLVVRRYDGGKIGYVDMKSGYNLRKPTDYPDVTGMDIPDRRPHIGKIKVEEHDELPNTEAQKKFKSQVENFEFDVNKLIKEAKTEKSLGKLAENVASDVLQSVTKPSVTFSDEILIDGERKSVDGRSTEIATASTAVDAVKSDNVLTNGNISQQVSSVSDVKHEGSEQQTEIKKDRFKVAIEVKVTNEARRDSMDKIEKVITIN